MRTLAAPGPSYCDRGYIIQRFSQYLQYRFAWQNTFPDGKWPRIEPLEHVASFFLETLYPTTSGFLTVNFEDSSLESRSATTVLLLIACGLGSPEAGRYLQFAPNQTQSALLTLLQQY